MNKKKILAIIPARGGSQRLPRKNILPLGGKPLIAWTIEAAIQSKYITKVIVSTDCPEIAEVSKIYGADVPFLRPTRLASDTATTNGLIMHAIKEVGESEFDMVALLQPTSPLRTAYDIDEAVKVLLKNDVKGVVSVAECEHSPIWSNTLPDDYNMGSFLPEKYMNVRSQDLPTYYRINGSIYIFSVKSILENEGVHYDRNTLAYIMPSKRSVDIDTLMDFKLAEFIHAQELNR